MTAVPSGPHDSDDIGMIELGHHDDFLGNGFHHTLLLGARIATKRNLKLYGLFNGRNNSKQIGHHVLDKHECPPIPIFLVNG